MSSKMLTVVFFRQNHIRPDWQVDVSGDSFNKFFSEMTADLLRLGIEINRLDNSSVSIHVNSYADLLNSVRITSPADGIGSQCIGHIIGKSQNLDLMEDIRRAVNRVAFAPETIEPDEGNRRVCHNCGCGC